MSFNLLQIQISPTLFETCKNITLFFFFLMNNTLILTRDPILLDCIYTRSFYIIFILGFKPEICTFDSLN